MSKQRFFRTAILTAPAALIVLSLATQAFAQSGTTAGKARAKVSQAQAASSGKAAGGSLMGHPAAPAPVAGTAGAHPATKPAGAAPATTQATTPAPQTTTQGGLTVIENDPNHLSAVKALEQIKRDEETSSEGNTFTYDPGDRRDPFLSPQDILAAQMSGQVCQGEGMECWLIQDVTVIGVLTRKTGNVALVIGPDGYGTTLREGDKLYDGEVRKIDPESGLVVFRQRISDPTRIKPFRDVEKGLDLKKEGRS